MRNLVFHIVFYLGDFTLFIKELQPALLDNPQILIAEEEKIIVEENAGSQIIVEEKSLVDTVYALKDQMKELKAELAIINIKIEEEYKARSSFHNLVRSNITAAGIVWQED